MNITLHLNETSGEKKQNKKQTNKQTNKKNDNNKIYKDFFQTIYTNIKLCRSV